MSGRAACMYTCTQTSSKETKRSFETTDSFSPSSFFVLFYHSKDPLSFHFILFHCTTVCVCVWFFENVRKLSLRVDSIHTKCFRLTHHRNWNANFWYRIEFMFDLMWCVYLMYDVIIKRFVLLLAMVQTLSAGYFFLFTK